MNYCVYHELSDSPIYWVESKDSAEALAEELSEKYSDNRYYIREEQETECTIGLDYTHTSPTLHQTSVAQPTHQQADAPRREAVAHLYPPFSEGSVGHNESKQTNIFIKQQQKLVVS